MNITEQLKQAADCAPLWKSIFEAAADEIERLQKVNVERDKKTKAEAFEAGFYESGDGFNGEWCGDKGEVSRLAQEYANKLERGES